MKWEIAYQRSKKKIVIFHLEKLILRFVNKLAGYFDIDVRKVSSIGIFFSVMLNFFFLLLRIVVRQTVYSQCKARVTKEKKENNLCNRMWIFLFQVALKRGRRKWKNPHRATWILILYITSNLWDKPCSCQILVRVNLESDQYRIFLSSFSNLNHLFVRQKWKFCHQTKNKTSKHVE